MNKRSLLLIGGFFACLWVTSSPAQQPVTFKKDIQPILEQSCWTCHGAAMQASKLDLRTREGAVKGGEHGAAIVPGKGEQSRMYRLIAGLDTPQMPLDGKKLSAAQVAAVKTWIDEGAHWDADDTTISKAPAAGGADPLAVYKTPLPANARDYWAFKLPVQAPLPKVSANFTNPIDLFLEKVREQKGLKPAPRADKLTLVRRAYLDLIGLPPTPAETAEFVNDNSPDAWPKLIDKLLTSEHYGERWGRHWLDVARYADSGGFENDTNRPNAWRYRDYVVRAFNEDKPYDRFVSEQLAGDELPDRNDDSYIATGFLRMGPRVQFREKDNPERRYDYLDDVISTVSRGFLGLTVQCARCHNHKFDPILQKDYYALEATLNGYVETEYPLVPKDEADAYAKKTKEINGKVAIARNQIKKIEAPYKDDLVRTAINSEFPDNVKQAFNKPEAERTEGEKLLVQQVMLSGFTFNPLPIDDIMSPEDLAKKKELNNQIRELQRAAPKQIPVADITTDGDYRNAPNGVGDETVGCPKCRIKDPDAGPYLVSGDQKYVPPPSYFLVRGDPNSKGPLMKPDFITVATYGNPPRELPPADGHTSGRRRALAEWMVSADNPLTSRVMVNRIWAYHFGKGIAATLDNLGKMGEQPTNPELLDWLAVEFRNRGWSIKQMHRLIMTSEAYQMASEYKNDADLKKDPQDTDLWKFRIQRLEAEIVRDSIMRAAGTIDLTMGGPPIFPYIPPEILRSFTHGTWRNQEDGPKVWRRSLYIYARRGLPFPFVQVFDLPDQNISIGARETSTVPTQALTLMNNAFVLNQAKLFANRLKETAGDDPAKQIDLAFRIALTRPPTDEEMAVSMDLVKSQSLLDFTNVVLNLSEFLYTR